ncbi:hypothetical protein BDR26DRAFT_875468 [Obelidium mucronatum]|nr:hypothetical protein BDR26DRAFT_875468 [Obelidium mucronatum]
MKLPPLPPTLPTQQKALKILLLILTASLVSSSLVHSPPGSRHFHVIHDSANPHLCWKSKNEIRHTKSSAVIELQTCDSNNYLQLWALAPAKRIRRRKSGRRDRNEEDSVVAFNIISAHGECVEDSENQVQVSECLEESTNQQFSVREGKIESFRNHDCLFGEEVGGLVGARPCPYRFQAARDNLPASAGPITTFDGQCWTIEGTRSFVNSTACDSSNAQKFVVSPFGSSGNFIIQSNDRKSCLDADSVVQMRKCDSNPLKTKTQLFTTGTLAAQGSTIQNVKSGMCLDMGAKLLTEAPFLSQWLCNNHVTELFNLPSGGLSSGSQSVTTTASTASPTPPPADIQASSLPNGKTLIQVSTYSTPSGYLCWQVDGDGGVIAALCDESNSAQWWSRSFAQLVFVNGKGKVLCAGFSNRDTGTKLTVSPCGSDSSQSMLFETDGTIRVASSYKCLGLNMKNANLFFIDQQICNTEEGSHQYFVATQKEVFFPPQTESKCSKFTYRKEWRDLTKKEKKAYVNAVQKVRKMPSTAGRRSYFDDLVSIHASVIDYIHGNPSFWPWHRYYLRIFEEALMKADASVVLPYWDWGYDGDAPLANTAIFGSTDIQFGTRGDPESRYPTCLKDGFAKQWISGYGQCSSRNYTLDVLIYADDSMYPNVMTTEDFSTFAKNVEAAHNVVHFYIGGTQGDLYFIDLSTNDPLFFVHHANVDRYWHLWQFHNAPNASDYNGSIDLPPGSKNQVTVQLTDMMPGWNLPTSYAMHADKGNGFCTKYVPYSQSGDSIKISDEPPLTKSNSERRRTVKRQVVGLKSSVPEIPSDWPMFSSYKEGYRPDDRAANMAMTDSMISRIREGESGLARLATDFRQRVASLMKTMPDSSMEEVHISAMQQLKPPIVSR